MGQISRIKAAVSACTPEEALTELFPQDALDYVHEAIEAGIPREGIQTVLRLLEESIPGELRRELEEDKPGLERAWKENIQAARDLIDTTED